MFIICTRVEDCEEIASVSAFCLPIPDLIAFSTSEYAKIEEDRSIYMKFLLEKIIKNHGFSNRDLAKI